MGPKGKFSVGMEVDYLTLHDKKTYRDGKGGWRTKWWCQCRCGRWVWRKNDSLLSPGRHSCGCLHPRKASAAYRPNWKGYGDIPREYFLRIEKAAKRRGIPLSVTIEQMWDLFVRQGGVCPFSGLAIAFNRGTVHTASLDRMDSAGPYAPGNLQWVHKDVNLMKKALSREKFVGLCRRVTDFQDGRSPAEAREEYWRGTARAWSGPGCSNWRGHGEISGSLYTRWQIVARKRKISFDVSIERLWELFLSQGRRCRLSGLPLRFGRYDGADKSQKPTASLDRIDSSGGYVERNLWWLHQDVNMMKSEFTVDRFLELCRLVAAHATGMSTPTDALTVQ